MGCRYCMPSCPFEIPKFEYQSANPKIQKCNLCWERLKKGEKPACVEACPEEALLFGSRKELIEEANRRIYQKPGKYLTHIYGEHEVGGTRVSLSLEGSLRTDRFQNGSWKQPLSRIYERLSLFSSPCPSYSGLHF